MVHSINDTNDYAHQPGELLFEQLIPYQCNSIDSFDIRLFFVSYKRQKLDIQSKKLYETSK